MPSTVSWLTAWGTGPHPSLLLSCLNHRGHLGSFCEWSFSRGLTALVDGCLLQQDPCFTRLSRDHFLMRSQLRSWHVTQEMAG